VLCVCGVFVVIPGYDYNMLTIVRRLPSRLVRLCAGGCYLQVHARLVAREESECHDDCDWLKTPVVGTAMFCDMVVLS
jgi:hypothetical protein